MQYGVASVEGLSYSFVISGLFFSGAFRWESHRCCSFLFVFGFHHFVPFLFLCLFGFPPFKGFLSCNFSSGHQYNLDLVLF